MKPILERAYNEIRAAQFSCITAPTDVVPAVSHEAHSELLKEAFKSDVARSRATALSDLLGCRVVEARWLKDNQIVAITLRDLLELSYGFDCYVMWGDELRDHLMRILKNVKRDKNRS